MAAAKRTPSKVKQWQRQSDCPAVGDDRATAQLVKEKMAAAKRLPSQVKDEMATTERPPNSPWGLSQGRLELTELCEGYPKGD